MIPDISVALNWLESHPNILDGIRRGIERETLRITPEGHLAASRHPKALGSALTHPWITTDFAEALLEFITPADKSIEHTLLFLKDLHRYTLQHMGNERFWPLSMPCFIDGEDKIMLAQYGSSPLGQFKTLYREGLKNRYGALMQTIAGVHYNFSLPLQFWQAMSTSEGAVTKETISDGYLQLIRNYYRFGWVICYLFGASPAICRSFLNGRVTQLPFESNGNMYYLPYATSLRMSDLGYTNHTQNNLDITFNKLPDYVAALRRAVQTPSEQFAQLGVKVAGGYRQLNANLLQIENEFYAPIRPKRVTVGNEVPTEALLRGGIEYIEVRALDINPFSPIGIDAEQIRFLDLFLIWCVLAPAPEMPSEELRCNRNNWNRVILEGRKPGLLIGIGCESVREPLSKVGEALFADLLRVAVMLDNINGDTAYQQVCNKWIAAFTDPSLTYSAKVLELIQGEGFCELGLTLSAQYREQLLKEPFTVLSAQQLDEAARLSAQRQATLEADTSVDFEEFLQRRLKSSTV